MKIITLMLSLLISSHVTAHSNNELAEEMKTIEEQFKVIAVGLQSGTLTQAELDACESLQKSVSVAAQHYPHTATSDSLKLTYMEWMNELMGLALELETEMEVQLQGDSQNLTDSLRLFRLINEVRKKGHDQFKESH